MGGVRWVWLSQTRPIPRSPDGDNDYNDAIRMCGTRVDAIDQPPSDVFLPGKFISSFGLLWIKISIETNTNYLMCY